MTCEALTVNTNDVYDSLFVKCNEEFYRISARKGTSEKNAKNPYEVLIFRTDRRNNVLDWGGMMMETYETMREASDRVKAIIEDFENIITACKTAAKI